MGSGEWAVSGRSGGGWRDASFAAGMEGTLVRGTKAKPMDGTRSIKTLIWCHDDLEFFDFYWFSLSCNYTRPG